MSDRPIIFSGPMVRALLEGRKTQTRRVIDPQPVHDAAFVAMSNDGRWIAKDSLGYGYLVNVPHAIGDRLWVKEAWFSTPAYNDLSPSQMSGDEPIKYQADGTEQVWGLPHLFIPGRYRPSIHMPRWASRITLTVTDVRVQRLQDISEADAVAEGINGHGGRFTGYGKAADQWMGPIDSFASLWISLHGTASWDANPWVVALTFTVDRRNIDEAKEAEE